MPPDAALRVRWRRRWLASIRELSDVTLQRLTWLNIGGENPHYSFVEYICTYFDDLGLSEGYGDAVRDGLVTPEEAEAVARFHKAFDSYQEPAGSAWIDRAVLSDPAWISVTVEARIATASLAALLSEQSELEMLNHPPESALAAALTAGEA